MRIRTIKPEWLDDELLASASDTARVLSVALILMSDDYGNGRARFVGSRVFPTNPGSADAAMAELVSARFVELYEIDEQQYFHVRNWEKHQRVDKPGKPHVPGPGATKPKRTASASKVAYFIRGATTGLIKIGESSDPIRRLAELAKGGSERLELLAVGGTERKLHAELSDDRVHGEWFRASPAVLAKVIEHGGDINAPISSCGYTENGKIDARDHSGDTPDDPANVPVAPTPDLRTVGSKDPDHDLLPACAGERPDTFESHRAVLLRSHAERYEAATGNFVPSGKNPPQDVAKCVAFLVGLALKRGHTFERTCDETLEAWWHDAYATSKGWPLWHLARNVDQFSGALPAAKSKGGMTPVASAEAHAADAAADLPDWATREVTA